MSKGPDDRVSTDDKDICLCCIVWGVTSTCTAAVKTKEQLYIVRVFLGVTEAPFFPGVVRDSNTP